MGIFVFSPPLNWDLTGEVTVGPWKVKVIGCSSLRGGDDELGTLKS